MALANIVGDGELTNVDPEHLAGLRFGSMRAETLEYIYRHSSDTHYRKLKQKNDTLLRLKAPADLDDIATFYSSRDAYYKDPKLQRLLQTVPKGNYAHLHFNAYLSIDGMSDVYKRVLGDPVFSGADTSDFHDLLQTARQPYGDLMEFPQGNMQDRADQ